MGFSDCQGIKQLFECQYGQMLGSVARKIQRRGRWSRTDTDDNKNWCIVLVCLP